MAVTAFAGHMGEQAIVFDCMDQLSQFKGAPKELLRRERELLAIADVVFAGGPKIGRDKIKYNTNTHSYGCGVDVKHFGTARSKSTEIPADVANLPGPVFGFFGVVDERMDYELVARARRRASAGQRGDHRADDQGRSRDDPPPPEPPLARRARLLAPSGLREGVRRVPDAFRHQRGDRVHQPHQGARIHGDGQAHRQHARRGRGTPVQRCGEDFPERARSSSQLCSDAAANPDAACIKRGRDLAARNSWESIVEAMEGHIAEAMEADLAEAASGAA